MTLKKKIAIGVLCLLLGLGGFYGYYAYSFSSSVADLFREQGVQNDAAKPLFEAVVTKKLKVGDSLDHAKEVLSYAGLSFDVDREPFPRPAVQSIYRAGRWSGFTIRLELDSKDRISKIDIHEYFTGP